MTFHINKQGPNLAKREGRTTCQHYDITLNDR